MQRTETLRQQATLMRIMAESFEQSPVLRDDLLALAKRCEEMVDKVAREVSERLKRPIGT